MAKAFTLDISAFKADINKAVKAYADKVEGIVDDELTGAVNEIATKAKQKAPKDQSHLSSSIHTDIDQRLQKEVDVDAFYAPYMEFGTGQKVKVPDEWATYASQFKGKQGNKGLDELLENLIEWVRRKGLAGTYSVKTQRRTGNKGSYLIQDAEVAYAIFLSIIRKGINPHPFLYPAYKEVVAGLAQRIQNKIDNA